MKKNSLWVMAAILSCGLAVTSCSTKDNPYPGIEKVEALSIDFENADSAYWQIGNGYLVDASETVSGSTGLCASIKQNKDRADYFLTPVDFTGAINYDFDMDFAIIKGSKDACMAVMSESNWYLELTNKNNWGWFWYSTADSHEKHNPYLFSFVVPGNTTTAVVNKHFADPESAEFTSDLEWEFLDANWYHLNLKVDIKARTVNYLVTDKADNSKAFSGVYELPGDESPLVVGVYERNNRNNADPGAILFDNVKVSLVKYKN